MRSMEVTRRVEFECCYIYNNQIEAHRCKLEVTVEGPQRFEDFGTVISFESLRRYILSVVPDKTFLCDANDPASKHVGDAFIDAGCRVLVCEFSISAENLCTYIAEKLQHLLNIGEPGIQIVELKLRENNDSYVSWRKE